MRFATQLTFLFFIFSIVGCSSAPKLEKFSAPYTSCDAKDLKPAEITNQGWYQSWYVDCKGTEYFCRYNKTNENGWNGCHPTAKSASED